MTKVDTSQMAHSGAILKVHLEDMGSVNMQNLRDSALSFAIEQSGMAHRRIRDVNAEIEKNNFLPSFSAWDYEKQAEILRGMGKSGLFLTRQYTTGGPDAWNRPFTTNYNPTNIHNHPNYAAMPGMAEFSAVINGYYIRSRHNDYKLKKPAPVGSDFLSTVDIPPPDVPTSVTAAGSVQDQIKKMQELFRNYDKGEWPEGFSWNLSYVEFWFEKYTSTVSDTFDSFRHQQYAPTVDAALREALKFNYGGYKDPTENLSFETPVVRAIDPEGNPILARLRYRIAAIELNQLGDLRSYIEPYEDWATVKRRAAQPNRYRIRDSVGSPGKMDELMQLIPGLDGEGATLSEKYGTVTLGDYSDSSQLNAAYYTRFAAGQVDASNRSGFKRGFNDPTLFVAMTTRPEVAPVKTDGGEYRFSYAIPLELILRTPLEKWNPYNAPEKTKSTLIGNGLQSFPYNGWAPDLRNFHTPSDFFGEILSLSQTDQADSGTSAAYITTPTGVVQMRASGIYINLPNIPSVPNPIRIRYPIYPVYHEGSHAYAQAEAMQEELNVIRGKSDISLDQSSQANYGLNNLKTFSMQEGVETITNRGIVGGCVATKSTILKRIVDLTGGTLFHSGRTFSFSASQSPMVPDNLSTSSVIVLIYIKNVSSVWTVDITQANQPAPVDSVVLYSLTIPANSTVVSDPYLEAALLTDLRRIEPNFPAFFDNPSTVSPILKTLRNSDYSVSFDIVSSVGAICTSEHIIVSSRATNGFTIQLASAADNVILRWKISKLDN